MNNTKTIKSVLTIVVAAMSIMSTSANAEITLDGSASWAAKTGTIDASDSDKLVVVVSGEHHFGNPGAITDVTYDGVSLTQGFNHDSPGKVACTAADIWYLDAPATSTGAIVASCNGNNYVMTAFLLSGTADGIGNSAIGLNAKSVELETAYNDSFVIAVHTMGGDHETDGAAHRNTAYPQNVDADAPLTELSAVANSSYNGHLTSYVNGVSAGTATYSFTSNYDYGINTFAAEFVMALIDPNLPNVDPGDDWISWSGAAVTLNPTVTNNDSQVPQRDLNYVWTAEPSDGVVFTPNANVEAPTVTITKAADTGDAAVVTLALAVSLDGQEGVVVEDMTIDVYDNACQAAQAIASEVIYDPADFNQDCITDIDDLAEIAAAWLVDYSITAPAEL